jgi:hypothetical protein
MNTETVSTGTPVSDFFLININSTTVSLPDVKIDMEKFTKLFLSVFRIHEILEWIRIRIRGSIHLTSGSGSGSCYFRHCLQDASKKLIFYTIFSAYYFLKVHLHHFSKIKSQKEPQNRRNQGFSYSFCMMIEGSGSGSRAGSGSGSIPLTQKHVDPVDPDLEPDPEH